MKALAIYNSKNKRFRRDGDEFKREAHYWRGAQGDEPYPIKFADVTDGRIRKEIRKMKGLSVLGVFDHGTPRGLPRMRESWRGVGGLARAIASVTDKITIILYACSCGRGWRWWKPRNKRDIEVRAESYNPRDGYAIALCCELAKLGVKGDVWAHLTAGHTTRNPNIVRVRQRLSHDGDIDGIVKRERVRVANMSGPNRFTFWRQFVVLS